MKIGEILVLGIPQFMPKSDNGLCWPRQARHTGELELSGSPGILSQSEGFLSKFGPISTKNWDNTPTYLLDTAAHRKHGLEIIWLYKKSPSPMSGPDTDTGTTFEINLPDVAFWASFYVHAMIAAAFNSLTEIKPWLGDKSDRSHAVSQAPPRPSQPGSSMSKYNDFPQTFVDSFPPSRLISQDHT